MAGIVHWLEDPNRERDVAHEHINKIRFTAEVALKLIQLRNKLSGEKMTVLEASQIAEAQQA